MKQSNKDLSKVFFNSVEEMNECYGIDAKMPSKLYSNADLVCYEIVEPFTYNYRGQHIFTGMGFQYLDYFGDIIIDNHNEITLESKVYEDDLSKYEGRCFVYVRVNEYLRKHLEKTLIGCEVIHYANESETPYREFVHSVKVGKLGIVVTNQDGFTGYLNNQLFYPDDYSDPIPYKEWVKKINEQGDEG